MALEVWLALIGLFFVGGLTPGPAVMLVMSASFRYGFWPAMLAALGIASANVIWLALAAGGAGALAATFPGAFQAAKYAGLIGIIILGVMVMRTPTDALMSKTQSLPPRAKLYMKGLALQLTNPLALVTFAIILPPFFDANRAIFPQFLIMITTLTYLELQGLAVYAGFGRALQKLLTQPRHARAFYITCGVVMIGAVALALFFTGK